MFPLTATLVHYNVFQKFTSFTAVSSVCNSFTMKFLAAARPAAPAQRTVPASKPAPSRGGAGDAKTVAPSGGGNTAELNSRVSELKLEV